MWSFCCFSSVFIWIILWSACCCKSAVPYMWVLSVFWISPVRMLMSPIRRLTSVSSRLSLAKIDRHLSNSGGGPAELEEWQGYCTCLVCAHSVLLTLCHPDSPASCSCGGWSQPGWNLGVNPNAYPAGTHPRMVHLLHDLLGVWWLILWLLGALCFIPSSASCYPARNITPAGIMLCLKSEG
jgi:hypothetical protein